MTVVVGVDGAGRTHRLGEIAESAKGPVTRLDATEPPAELASLLAAARADGALVVVDDADRLPGAMLDVLARAARQGVAMVITRRPTISSPQLAELDRAVAAHGPVELLQTLDVARTGALVARAAGRPASPDDVRRVHQASCGLPAVVLAVASVPAGAVAPALVARVQQRLAVLEPTTAELARVLALRLDLADDVLAQAAGIEPVLLAPSMRALRDAGMLAPDGDRLVPAVGDAVLAELPPTGRRRLHDSVAKAMLAANTDPITAAEQLIAAKARTPVAAQVYADAAQRLRFADPAAAARWYLHALEAGAEPAVLATGRAEVAALLGEPVELDSLPTSGDAARSALLIGADAAHQGRAGRAADALLAAGPPGPVLAVPALMATGRLDEAKAAAAGDAPLSLRLLADAAVGLGDGGARAGTASGGPGPRRGARGAAGGRGPAAGATLRVVHCGRARRHPRQARPPGRLGGCHRLDPAAGGGRGRGPCRRRRGGTGDRRCRRPYRTPARSALDGRSMGVVAGG